MSKHKIGKFTHTIPAAFRNNASRATLEILNAFPAVSQIWTVGAKPDHNSMRCTDFMVFNNHALGQKIANYAVKHAKRLGVEYIAWNNKAWRDTARRGQPKGWGKLFVPANASVTQKHMDHPHIQFKNKTFVPLKPPEKPKFLPVYVVDAHEVETFLWGIDHETGDTVKERAPGYRIRTGVEIVTIDGDQWLLTDAGYRYHMGFLVKESDV